MSNRLLIVGAGRIAKDLVTQLSEGYQITCIDKNAEALEELKTVQENGEMTIIQGDATSRLVLKEAQVDDMDMVLLTISKEKINLETARILREKFSVARIISIGITPKGIAELEELEIEVANIFKASANNILNIIQSHIRTPQGIGAGQGEILEVTVHPQSRLVNKPLSRLAPKNWQVGIIYRDDKIIVPGGKIRLMPEDRVVIMGEPSVLKSVSELLTFSTHDFPIEYGSLALVYIGGTEKSDYFSEVQYLLSTLPFSEVVFMLSPKIKDPETYRTFFDECPHIFTVHTTTEHTPIKAILKSVGLLSRNCGLIIGQKNVLQGKPAFLPYRDRLFRTIIRCTEQYYAPIVFCRGTAPYEKVSIPAIPPSDIKPLLETALEVSSQLASELTVFLSSPSSYTGAEDEILSFDTMKKTISDMGLLYKRKVPVTSLKGNPVHEVMAHIGKQNLLVLEPREWKIRGLISSLLNPDPILHILARSNITTILQPLESGKKSPQSAENRT